MTGKNFAILHIKKMKNNDLTKIGEHNRRESPTGKYSNPNIDPDRTPLNVRRSEFSKDEKLKTLVDRRIAEREEKNKKVRKDAVKMISVLITASPEYLKNLNRDEQIRYFDEALDFCRKKFNRENVIEMNIHFDEINPHAHISVVPMINGKLCAKEIVTRKFLFSIQKEFPEEMKKKGFNVERGGGGDPAVRRKHLSEEEFRLTAWEGDIKKKESNLKNYEKKLEEKLSELMISRQALQDAREGPKLQLTISEPVFGDKTNVKVDRAELKKVLDRAEISNQLIASLEENRLQSNRFKEELELQKKEAAEQKRLAEKRVELLRELENEHRMILKENGEIRDRNAELYTDNCRMHEYIEGKGLSDDFEDWAAALNQVSAEIGFEK